MPSLAWLLTSALAATAASAAAPDRPHRFTYALVAQRATLTPDTLTLHAPFPYALWWTTTGGGDAAGAGMFDAGYLLSRAYTPPSPPNTPWMNQPPAVLIAGGAPFTADPNASPASAYDSAGDDDDAVVLRVSAPCVVDDGAIIFAVSPADNATVDGSVLARNYAAAVGAGGPVPALNLTNVALLIDDVAGGSVPAAALAPAGARAMHAAATAPAGAKATHAAASAPAVANSGRRLAQAGLARAIRGSPDPQAAAQAWVQARQQNRENRIWQRIAGPQPISRYRCGFMGGCGGFGK